MVQAGDLGSGESAPSAVDGEGGVVPAGLRWISGYDDLSSVGVDLVWGSGIHLIIHLDIGLTIRHKNWGRMLRQVAAAIAVVSPVEHNDASVGQQDSVGHHPRGAHPLLNPTAHYSSTASSWSKGVRSTGVRRRGHYGEAERLAASLLSIWRTTINILSGEA